MATGTRRVEEARRKAAAVEHLLSPDLFQCINAAIDEAFDDEGNLDAEKFQRAAQDCWKKKHPGRAVTVAMLLFILLIAAIIA